MALSTYNPAEDQYVEQVLATWGLRLTDAQLDWIKANGEKLDLAFSYKLEFVKLTSGKHAVIVYQFATRKRDGGRFLTDCPHGDRHAAYELPLQRILDELPADEVLYAPEPENHRFDNE